MNIITKCPIYREEYSNLFGKKKKKNKDKEDDGGDSAKSIGAAVSGNAIKIIGALGGLKGVFGRRPAATTVVNQAPAPIPVTHMSKGLKIGLIVGGSVVLIGIGIGVFYMLKNKK